MVNGLPPPAWQPPPLQPPAASAASSAAALSIASCSSPGKHACMEGLGGRLKNKKDQAFALLLLSRNPGGGFPASLTCICNICNICNICIYIYNPCGTNGIRHYRALSFLAGFEVFGNWQGK